MLYGLARLLIFNRMLKKLGLHRVRLALSSGAPLPEEVQALWQIWGVNLKNLYGQTECGVVTAQFAAVSAPGHRRPALSGQRDRARTRRRDHLRLARKFLRLLAGRGRHRRHAAPDGIRTGDVGTVGDDGVLRIVDRKKDIVITAGGKNVSPSRIETTLKSSPYISEASVIGEGRKYLTALVEIDIGTVSEWARAKGVAYSTYRSLATNAEVYRLCHARSSRPTRRSAVSSR